MAEVKTKNTEAKIMVVMQEAVGILDDHVDKKQASVAMQSLKKLYPDLKVPEGVASNTLLDEFLKKHGATKRVSIHPFQLADGMWGGVLQELNRTCSGCGQ